MISRFKTVLAAFGIALMFVAAAPAMANPCAPANACNPCASKNACNPCNPPAANACNPCGAVSAKRNPCDATTNPNNPCGAAMQPIDAAKFTQPKGSDLAKGKAKKGAKLWTDPSVSDNGSISCSTCHPAVGAGPYAMMNDSFGKSYPHKVKMAEERAGVKKVNAAEMVNFCMLVPMKSEPLAWDSKELADLAAYVESVQGDYEPVAGMKKANPCNPCEVTGARNPCGEAKNACNPCSEAKNACNPCGN